MQRDIVDHPGEFVEVLARTWVPGIEAAEIKQLQASWMEACKSSRVQKIAAKGGRLVPKSRSAASGTTATASTGA
jgi:hypothetical protein